jgi:hypothetical protein
VGLKEMSEESVNFNLWPNPTSGIINLEFHLERTAPVCIIIYNTMGQHEKMLRYDSMLPGLHEVEMDISGINPGIYFLKIESDKTEITKLIIQ